MTVLLWWFERRSRKAEVEEERIDRREQLEVDRQLREEKLRLTRIQVEGELAEREAKRRAEQAAADDAEVIRRTPIRVGGHIVAEELRANAEVARRCEEGSHVPSEAQHIRLFDWWGRRGEMAGLRDEAPELWEDLERTYAALELPPGAVDGMLRLSAHIPDTTPKTFGIGFGGSEAEASRSAAVHLAVTPRYYLARGS